MMHAVETLAFSGSRKNNVGVPWHGIGVEVHPDKQHTTEEWIEASGLSWEVGLAPLVVMPKDSMIQAGLKDELANQFDGVHGNIVNRFATVRLSDKSILGTVGPQYHILQNKDAFAWFQPFIDNGECSIELCGSLFNGQKVWVLAKINRDPGMVNGDQLNKFLMLSNSHDGSMAVRVGSTMTRICCHNTMTAALNDKASKLIRIRHSSKMDDNLKNIRSTIDAINDEMNATIELYKKLRNSSVNQSDLRKYVKMVFDVDIEKKESELPTRTINLIDKVIGYSKDSPGTNGNDLYSAYNAVTFYLTHDYGRNAENRFDSINFGTSANTSQRALKIALEMAV